MQTGRGCEEGSRAASSPDVEACNSPEGRGKCRSGPEPEAWTRKELENPTLPPLPSTPIAHGRKRRPREQKALPEVTQCVQDEMGARVPNFPGDGQKGKGSRTEAGGLGRMRVRETGGEAQLPMQQKGAGWTPRGPPLRDGGAVLNTHVPGKRRLRVWTPLETSLVD